MFALKAADGWASGRYGRFTYSSYQIATIAAKILGKRDRVQYKVVDA